jgi:hypothetical protein
LDDLTLSPGANSTIAAERRQNFFVSKTLLLLSKEAIKKRSPIHADMSVV